MIKRRAKYLALLFIFYLKNCFYSRNIYNFAAKKTNDYENRSRKRRHSQD